MANNYFGFNHGGTQYSGLASTNTGVTAQQTAYGAAATGQAAYATHAAVAAAQPASYVTAAPRPAAGVATSAYDAYSVASNNQYAAAYTAAAASRQQQATTPTPTQQAAAATYGRDAYAAYGAAAAYQQQQQHQTQQQQVQKTAAEYQTYQNYQSHYDAAKSQAQSVAATNYSISTTYAGQQAAAVQQQQQRNVAAALQQQQHQQQQKVQPTAQHNLAALQQVKAATQQQTAYYTPAATPTPQSQLHAAAAHHVAAAASAHQQSTAMTGVNAMTSNAAAAAAAAAVVAAATANTAAYQQPARQWFSGNQGASRKPGLPFNKKAGAKLPPKPQQLYYCEVCKISCAGPQTYKEHLDGQKHKKKEAAAKASGGSTAKVVAAAGRPGQNTLRCELCDVACTGADAYAAHIRGAKHQKVMKLHQKLGKPIPSTDPVLVAAEQNAAKKAAAANANGDTAKAKTPTAQPKINFLGGSQTVVNALPKAEKAGTPGSTGSDDADNKSILEQLQQAEVAPVGMEYIEEVKNEVGKVVSFNCKLCECKFNDPNAKEMHMKGRRHRLQYKKKVDPNLQVDVKPSIRNRKYEAQKEEFWRRREEEERWRMELAQEQHHFWEAEAHRMEMWGGPPFPHPMGPPMMPPMGPRGPFPHPRMMHPGMHPMGPGMGPPGMPPRRPASSDDRHVMAKHQTIYPQEDELQAVQNIVSSTEKALKLVSDAIAEEDTPKDEAAAKKPKADVEIKEEPGEGGKELTRTLKGVMRVGVLAKGLLLHGDLNVQLVVLCADKPTLTLLKRVAEKLPKTLKDVAGEGEEYKVEVVAAEAAVRVEAAAEPKASITITLTSPTMRENQEPSAAKTPVVKTEDPADVLNKAKCLTALAELRHAKWFQARANGLPSCVVLIRIMRHLIQNIPVLSSLSQWAVELLVEKCISSGPPAPSPGEAFRRIFECLASGILLPGSPGVHDPCEKEPTDASGNLGEQEKEDITAFAQNALRLMAFRQIHLVLEMEALPMPRFKRFKSEAGNRKRRRDETGAEIEGDGADGVDGKKDKKEEGKMETA